jgi:hypothetical protein
LFFFFFFCFDDDDANTLNWETEEGYQGGLKYECACRCECSKELWRVLLWLLSAVIAEGVGVIVAVVEVAVVVVEIFLAVNALPPPIK